ncbi:hypothetical protein [Arthrobacter bambusae]|uniref:hypothetical protein n=1 Tax=Arthrobacter bambusae TaxID=1338426 RepID=UPI00278A8EF1|nr:hypothetical protein [Arthrobacter bambusae]MDQ0029020.1 hypothetical protein [Arthrobacter bambusae]MDQ0098578.1 hypothetical protein [Arthrobacter bambusae]
MSAQAATSVGPTTGASVTLFSCFAGMGAALVELSIASSYISGRGPLAWTGGIFAAWGLALLASSVASLQRGRLRFRKPTTIGLLAAALVHVGLLMAGMTQRVLDGGHLAALFLVLMALGSSAWLDRRYPDDGGTTVAAPRAGALLAATFAAAVVVAAITTPGLAASVAGAHAVPHGEHSLPGGHNH